jgi:hypothetical protein
LRIADKVVKASKYTFNEFHEAWLLVAASIPRSDAVASTFIVPRLMSANDLQQETGDVLRQSKYARVYLYIGVGETLYEWQPAHYWRLIHGNSAQPAQLGGRLSFNSVLSDPGWLSDPAGKARAKAQKVLDELGALRKNTTVQ